LESADHRLLRSRPPVRALSWVAESLGEVRVVGSRARSGGMSSAVHVVHLEDRSGERFRLVLRRYVRADWLAEEPDVAAREADALRILDDSPLPVPRLVAVDPTGELAGSPALLMTALPGRVDWSPRDLNAWLKQLVAVLPVIHATRILEGVLVARDRGVPRLGAQRRAGVHSPRLPSRKPAVAAPPADWRGGLGQRKLGCAGS
jgi:hypothetical protein